MRELFETLNHIVSLEPRFKYTWIEEKLRAHVLKEDNITRAKQVNKNLENKNKQK